MGKDDLAERVEKFQALELPGQPMGMHLGTMYLVNDLWREVQRVRAAAPDLLGALELVRDMLVEVVTYTDTPDVENDPVWRDIHGRAADCLRTASAAIAKAGG